jgi:ABC-type multidrug transport system fused ATPase/permease subunit
VEYLELPQEPAAVIESHRPPAYWPSSETKDYLLQVKNLSIRYSPELPSVLHHISFNLKAKERIGLLGRTGKHIFLFAGPMIPSKQHCKGSGKSTLAQSILRFVSQHRFLILISQLTIFHLS